jgi:hypothetical protein
VTVCCFSLSLFLAAALALYQAQHQHTAKNIVLCLMTPEVSWLAVPWVMQAVAKP